MCPNLSPCGLHKIPLHVLEGPIIRILSCKVLEASEDVPVQTPAQAFVAEAAEAAAEADAEQVKPDNRGRYSPGLLHPLCEVGLTIQYTVISLFWQLAVWDISLLCKHR